jgi:hypothetical protein
VLLTLYPLAALAAEAGAGPPGQGAWTGVTLGVNVDSADAVDEAFAGAVAAGARAVAGPADRPWGGRSGYIADPEGNRWEIAWAPGLAFDEREPSCASGQASNGPGASRRASVLVVPRPGADGGQPGMRGSGDPLPHLVGIPAGCEGPGGG